MTTTDKSRADALTDHLYILSANEEVMEEAIERFDGSSSGEALKCVLHAQKQIRALLMTHVERPAAAPIDSDHRKLITSLRGLREEAARLSATMFREMLREVLAEAIEVLSAPAPSPAEERAAFNEAMANECPEFQRPTYTADDVYLNVRAVARSMWLAGIAYARSSANETGAEGAWPTREEAVSLYKQIRAQAHKNPIGYIEAAELEKLGDPEFGSTGESHVRLWHSFNPPSRALIPVYGAPAQADARDGLTDEQRRAISSGIAALERNGWTDPARALRALLQGANHAE